MDSVIKASLFLLAPWLLDQLVCAVSGAPLRHSLLWSLRNLNLAHKPLLILGIVVALFCCGFAYGVTKDLYQSLVSRAQTVRLLGYHAGQEHYLIGEPGAPVQISVNRPGPGERHLDRVFQQVVLMYNPIGKYFWPLNEVRNTPWFLVLTLASLLFVLPALGYTHMHYLDSVHPELPIVSLADGISERQYGSVFVKAVFACLTNKPIPVVLVLATIIGALLLQAQRFKGQSKLEYQPVPKIAKPGVVLSATLVDTYSKHVASGSSSQYATSRSRGGQYFYYGIFELESLYPHSVWLAVSLDDHTESDGARLLFDKLRLEKTLRPRFSLLVTQDLTLNFAVEKTLQCSQPTARSRMPIRKREVGRS